MSIFHFKNFDVEQGESPQKVGTDAMVLGALVRCQSPQQILDVGTGCGVIALMLAQQFQEAEVTGLDIHQIATEEAHFNFKNSPFKKRLKAIHQSFLSFQSVNKFDLIVANPPFFEQSLNSSDQNRNLARHEKEMTLVELVLKAKSLLSQQGEIWIIIPSDRSESITKEAEQSGVFLHQQIYLYGKPNRHVRDVLVLGKSKPVDLVRQSFTIRDENGNYTREYRDLTNEFHWEKGGK